MAARQPGPDAPSDDERKPARRVVAVVAGVALVGVLAYAFATWEDPRDQPVITNDEDAPTLAEAIARARPQMVDTPNASSAGTLILLGWSNRHLTWRDVEVSPDETSYELVQKDVEAQRGKRMCVVGKVERMHPVRTDSARFNTGLLRGPGGTSFAFMAVKSAGGVGAGITARLCGVVTGRNDVDDPELGPPHAVIMVGMFDLPDNKTRDQ